ncbi:hypothetical protein P5673_001168 [Acropora cervicornis]|uniref:Uncharacterized protein n=1 Tax=Acropora cervicornis TaxID=6130 RepID=A0AAD9R5N6_ACRCE|nr:hypothetical protein P5673_001168 [Acropora cervicornis]
MVDPDPKFKRMNKTEEYTGRNTYGSRTEVNLAKRCQEMNPGPLYWQPTNSKGVMASAFNVNCRTMTEHTSVDSIQ